MGSRHFRLPEDDRRAERDVGLGRGGGVAVGAEVEALAVAVRFERVGRGGVKLTTG